MFSLFMVLRSKADRSGSSPDVLEHAALARDGDRLVLTLRGPGQAFAGETVERRLQTLAGRLDCVGELAAVS